MRLWIHLMVTGHYPGRVPPFGNSGINVHLQLPRTYRSLSRPSSAISALASTLRSFSLDLAAAVISFLRLLRTDHNLIRFVSSLCSFQGARPLSRAIEKRLSTLFQAIKPGGLKWTRTTDLTLIRRVL